MKNLSALLETAEATPQPIAGRWSFIENSRLVAAVGLKRARIAAICVVVVAALFGLAGTNVGARAFSQLGITSLFAQTLAATDLAVERTGNALNAFLGRSPGARGETDLLKSKVKRAALAKAQAPAGTKPTQRALGKVFDQPEDNLVGALLDQPPGIFLPIEPAGAGAPSMAIAPASIGSGSFSPIGGGFGPGGSIIGGGGSGGGNPPPPVANEPPPVIPPVFNAVPEPSTWILLLFGFGAIGASIRRSKAGLAGSSGLTGSCAKI